MLTLSTVKCVVATFPQQSTGLNFSKPASSWRSELRRELLDALPAIIQPLLFVCSFVAFSVTAMQWYWERGTIFVFLKLTRN